MFCSRLQILGSLVFFCHCGFASTLCGYTLHFDFLSSPVAAREAVETAAAAGAKVISLVPPAHIWEDNVGRQTLQAALEEAARHHLRVIFSRLDACQSSGKNWLFANALTERGRLPDGRASSPYLCATVGNTRFVRWQREETVYYARHYGRLANLLAIAVGGMVEPFVSQRGSLLEWCAATNCYEIAQYTAGGLHTWQEWLRNHWGSVLAVNTQYQTHFHSFTEIPMPRNASDPRFGQARAAYFDFARSLNDWLLTQYRENRRLWREQSCTPFLLQFNGGATEKIARGRPEFAAFDLPAWLEEADGVGISLYTNAGFADWGHSHNFATLQLLLSACLATGKPAFVMECGCEAPEVTLTPHELSYATRMGMLLDPRAYIYEYFRYARGGCVQPGMMVTPQGRRCEPAFTFVSQWIRGVGDLERVTSVPCFHYLSVPLAARAGELAGRVNRAVYYLAGYVPCRLLSWHRAEGIANNQTVLVPPGCLDVLTPEELHRFLRLATVRRWVVLSDEQTCLQFRRLRKDLRLHSLPLQRLLRDEYVEEEAGDLFHALHQLPEFRRSLQSQPLEPREGLHWIESGARLYIWVDDEAPVVVNLAVIAQRGIRKVWCSTRSGRAATFLSSGARKYYAVPCRLWVNINDLPLAARGEV